MRRLPDLHTTRGLVIWSLLFLLFVESIWTINYLAPAESASVVTKQLSQEKTTSVGTYAEAQETAPTIDPDATAILSLKTDTNSPTTGQSFNVAVKLNTGGKTIDGTSIKLKYDPSVLEVPAANTAKVGTMFPLTLNNSAEKGIITVSAVANPTGPFFNGNDTVATIPFVAKKAGRTDITFQAKPGDTTDTNVVSHDKAGVDILRETENLSIDIEQ